MRTFRITAAAVFMLALATAFVIPGTPFAALPHLQFGPAFMSLFAAFAAGALAVVLAIALVTLLFGRIYCAVFCPWGILQDVIGFISRRPGRRSANLACVRYIIAGVAVGALCGGSAVLFRWLDPYSDFGRAVGSFTAGGMVPLAMVAVLVVWKKRLYCTTICPVGTLLGLLAKRGVFRLRLTDKCVKCGRCVKACPAGCIDPGEKTLDNERCVRCLNCVSVCRLHAVKFGLPEKSVVPVDQTRRAFLVSGGVLIAGLAAGAVLAKTGLTKLADYAKRFKILPPGAGNAERFSARCTSCQLCTANCPAGIIRPAQSGFGPVSLDFSRGGCRNDCNRCTQVCPAGALEPLSLNEKQHLRIAEAAFDPTRCRAFQEGVQCGFCASACPTQAITLRKSGAPRLNQAKCIGCGNCQAACPVDPKAMTVNPIEKQISI